jgi:hypothetical protein
MGTYTPNTTLLVAHVAAQLATIVTPTWRTNIGANVSSEGQQVLDDTAPLCSVRLTGWESSGEGTAVLRVCDLEVEAVVPGTDANAEAQALLVAEDLFERFRLPGAGVTLAAGVEAVIRPVDSARIERPEGAAAVIARLSLRADLYELL